MTEPARKVRPLAIDVLVESDHWVKAKDAVSVAKRAIEEAAVTLSTPRAELAIVLSDDSAIHSLNRAWRGVDAATNVLSFPTRRTGGAHHVIGDIALAYETIEREARVQRKPFAHHLAHLAVHGFLHLLGYDHERYGDAERMEGIERDVLRRLGIPDPYRRAGKRSSANRQRTLLTEKP
jgi:probable rRNA maturation factor